MGWSERPQGVVSLLLLLPLLVLYMSGGVPLSPIFSDIRVFAGGFFMVWLCSFGARYWFIKQNEKIDREIEDACKEMATATGLHVEYRTKFVSLCVSKRSPGPFRAVIISPWSD